MPENKESTPPPPSDRRGGERHMACFPAYVVREEGSPRASMIQNLSVSGALLLSRRELPAGERVRLQLYIFDDVNEHRVASGKVVRSEPLGDDAVGLWTCRIGVQFDEPLVADEKAIVALAERQERLRA